MDFVIGVLIGLAVFFGAQVAGFLVVIRLPIRGFVWLPRRAGKRSFFWGIWGFEFRW